MIPRSWRIKFFNYLGAGRITLKDDQQENKTMSTYTLNGAAGAVQNWGLSGITLTEPQYRHAFRNTITIKVTPATGGHIVSVSTADSSESDELHIIPESADFDRELGKIITLNRLRQ